MYNIYQTSPRRSPRHMRPTMDLNSNILKPKTASPIRKSNAGQSIRKAPSSANALAKITGNEAPKKFRKSKVNDENKENCNTASRPVRTGGLGVNGSMVSGKNTQPLTSKSVLRNGRLPLKELPLNFGTGDAVRSVEIVSTVAPNLEEAPVASNPRGNNRNAQALDDGIGIGSDWDANGTIR